MKTILKLCVVCLIVAFVGCETTEDASSSIVSPGAVSECGVNCECCPNSPNYKDPNASLGAVNDTPNCSGAPTTCSGSKADASLGAVSEKSSCGSGAKKSCSGKKADASLGAVSDTPGHCSGSGSGPCPYAGKKSDG